MNKLTVFYENSFWVGVFEKIEGNKIKVCKVTFYKEPKSYDIYEFILKNYYKIKYSTDINCSYKNKKHKNPKKLQRQIKKDMMKNGVSKKAFEAIRIEREKNKIRKKIFNKKQKELEKKIKFEKKQKKKLEKKKGH